MNINIEENIEKSEENINIDVSPNFSKQKILLNNNNSTKKEKKKRNKKIKIDKSKQNISSKSNSNLGGGILSEIKQITIPDILCEKENLFKILQSEMINIDKGIALLNKKKKYYDEIIQKLEDEIQTEKKNIKKDEIKNQEYLYMENLLKDIDINETFKSNNLINDNSFYNLNKAINENLDYNYFLLNQKNNKNFLLINFFSEKNISKINNKMEPNFQMSYEEFNNIGDMEDNFCILMNNEITEKKEEEKIIIENNLAQNNNNDDNNIDIDIIKNSPIKEKEEFTIINEAPPEEEETNNKKRKKISMKDSSTNSNNKIENKDLDENINKDYSNSEELDFYLLKNSNKKEDINKKYKVQDMGSDFLPSDSVSSDNINKKVKKKKKEKKNKKEIDINSNSENSDINDINNINNINKEENNDISDDNSKEENNGNKKNKKRGRKKKKKEIQASFALEEDYPDPENLDNTALSLEMKKYGMKPQNKKKNIEILKSVYNFLKIKEIPENIQKKLTTFDCDNNENISDSDNDNFIGSKKNEELNEETKKKIIRIIKENKNIYEKILLFKEISIKEIKNILNAKGIIVPNHSLSQLLINSGVVLPGGWNNKK